jgi:hypothetical protein
MDEVDQFLEILSESIELCKAEPTAFNPEY